MPFLCRAKRLRCPAGAVEDVTCRRGALACEPACVGPAGEHVPRAGQCAKPGLGPSRGESGLFAVTLWHERGRECTRRPRGGAESVLPFYPSP